MQGSPSLSAGWPSACSLRHVLLQWPGPLALSRSRSSKEPDGWRGLKTRATLGPWWAIRPLVLWSVQATALPYVPAHDGDVLERVTARSAIDRLEPLRRTVTANPRNLSATLELARGYLGIGRVGGDQRFVAYAQAALLPWLRDGNAPLGG